MGGYLFGSDSLTVIEPSGTANAAFEARYIGGIELNCGITLSGTFSMVFYAHAGGYIRSERDTINLLNDMESTSTLLQTGSNDGPGIIDIPATIHFTGGTFPGVSYNTQTGGFIGLNWGQIQAMPGGNRSSVRFSTCFAGDFVTSQERPQNTGEVGYRCGQNGTDLTWAFPRHPAGSTGTPIGWLKFTTVLPNVADHPDIKWAYFGVNAAGDTAVGIGSNGQTIGSGYSGLAWRINFA